MSYRNQTAPLLENPVGLDKAIQSIQADLANGLTWLERSFGRAYEFKEKDEEGTESRVPKVYTGLGEYYNVLPNDNFAAQSFMACRDAEKWAAWTDASGNAKTRQVSLIFWFNLKRIDPTKDYIFTEELKKQVETILKQNAYVGAIEQYFDERAENVFDGYLPAYRYAAYSVDDERTQFLMYPYAGFRFDLLLNYWEDC
jgi:hypothetical protein